MSHIRLWTSAGIIATVLIISFMLSVPHTRDLPRSAEPEKEIFAVPNVILHDSYKKGVHTIAGSLMTPNACMVATAVATSSADRILVSVTMPEDTGVCLQEPSRATFSVTISAQASLPIQVTVNDLVASTTLQ